MARRTITPIAVPGTVGHYTASQPTTTLARNLRLQLDAGGATDRVAVFATDAPGVVAGVITGGFDPLNRSTWPPGARRFLCVMTGAEERYVAAWGPYALLLRVEGTAAVNLVASGLGPQTEVTAPAPTTVGNHGDGIDISAIEGALVVGFQDDATTADAADVYLTDKAMSAGAGLPVGARKVGAIGGGAAGTDLKVPEGLMATTAVLVRTAGTTARTVRFSGAQGDQASSISSAGNATINATGATANVIVAAGRDIGMTATRNASLSAGPLGEAKLVAGGAALPPPVPGQAVVAGDAAVVTSAVTDIAITSNQDLNLTAANHLQVDAAAQDFQAISGALNFSALSAGMNFNASGQLNMSAASLRLNGLQTGFFGKTPVNQPATYTLTFSGAASRTLPDFTLVPAGLDNSHATTVYASLADLNATVAEVKALAAVVKQWLGDANSLGLTA
jgi:hypothetical protein